MTPCASLSSNYTPNRNCDCLSKPTYGHHITTPAIPIRSCMSHVSQHQPLSISCLFTSFPFLTNMSFSMSLELIEAYPATYQDQDGESKATGVDNTGAKREVGVINNVNAISSIQELSDASFLGVAWSLMFSESPFGVVSPSLLTSSQTLLQAFSGHYPSPLSFILSSSSLIPSSFSLFSSSPLS